MTNGLQLRRKDLYLELLAWITVKMILNRIEIDPHCPVPVPISVLVSPFHVHCPLLTLSNWTYITIDPLLYLDYL